VLGLADEGNQSDMQQLMGSLLDMFCDTKHRCKQAAGIVDSGATIKRKLQMSILKCQHQTQIADSVIWSNCHQNSDRENYKSQL